MKKDYRLNKLTSFNALRKGVGLKYLIKLFHTDSGTHPQPMFTSSGFAN